ncbi:synaptic vesicle glycoprotein 2B-like [Aricia agestis]|uniref:synaptic vesicle glycoprotein 2B-like n=1 Tax=Aricia agestis TaxID=91739 RepID=UPI001C20ACDA|nr:synaptic vesicle glycoprotein 2B-like [Aricia agestis]
MEMTDETTTSKDEAANSMQILEDALTICKFGKFHWKLLAATLCATCASVLTVTTSSYILPAAECDLNMSAFDKGMLNAMPFIGQVGFTLFAGFLVDGFGRKVFLVWGNIGIFLFTILEGSSQNYWMLMMMKFGEGVSLSLSFAAISPMFTEFLPRGLRDRLLLLLAAFRPLSLIVTALVSWALLPRDIHLVVAGFELHAWNIYIYVCSVWSIIAVALYYQLPESPKFLLSHGQESRALEVLRTIYTTNTGESGENFPISSLTTSRTHIDQSGSVKRRLVRELAEVKHLIHGPLLCRLLLFAVITFVCLSTYMSLRLWYPQLSTTIENYHREHDKAAGFCEMLQYRKQKANLTLGNRTVQIDTCIPQFSGKETYLNAILMGFISLIFLGISVLLVDYIGQKLLMFISLILSAVCSISLYWTNSSIQIAILFSATCSFLQLTLSLKHSIFVRVFPTTLRALAISIDVMVGRVGSLLGNIVFPILLEMECMAPFITVSTATLSVAGLTYFLQNPKRTGVEK